MDVKKKAIREERTKNSDRITDLTNGEMFKIVEAQEFLNFMVDNGYVEIPTRIEDRTTLMARYIKHVRREQMEYVNKLRISRGESPLPKRLLK